MGVRGARKLDYADDITGIITKVEEVDLGLGENNPMKLFFKGEAKPSYMPKNWHPDWELDYGDEVRAYWSERTIEDENGIRTIRTYNLSWVGCHKHPKREAPVFSSKREAIAWVEARDE